MRKVPVVRNLSLYNIPIISIFGEWTLTDILIITGTIFISLSIFNNFLNMLIILGIVLIVLTLPKQFSKTLSTIQFYLAITRYIIKNILKIFKSGRFNW